MQWEYTKAFTNAPYLVKDGFGYQDGLFTGYDEIKRDYDHRPGITRSATMALSSSTTRCSNPRCVWNLLKQHVSIYTPELVERICGTPKEKFLKSRR